MLSLPESWELPLWEVLMIFWKENSIRRWPMVLPFQHKRGVTSPDRDHSSFPEGKADWNLTTIPEYFRVCIYSCRLTASCELGAHKSHSLPPGRKPRHVAKALGGYNTDQWPSDAWRKWTTVWGCTVAQLKEPIENISSIEWQNITHAHTLKPRALKLFEFKLFQTAMLTSPSPSPAHHHMKASGSFSEPLFLAIGRQRL